MLSNLTVDGRTPFPNAYWVGVRKDDLLLLSSMEKTVSALPPATAGAILERGFKIPIVRDVDYTLLWRVLAIAALNEDLRNAGDLEQARPYDPVGDRSQRHLLRLGGREHDFVLLPTMVRVA